MSRLAAIYLGMLWSSRQGAGEATADGLELGRSAQVSASRTCGTLAQQRRCFHALIGRDRWCDILSQCGILSHQKSSKTLDFSGFLDVFSLSSRGLEGTLVLLNH